MSCGTYPHEKIKRLEEEVSDLKKIITTYEIRCMRYDGCQKKSG